MGSFKTFWREKKSKSDKSKVVSKRFGRWAALVYVTALTVAGTEDDPTRCPRLTIGCTESASVCCIRLCIRSRVVWLW